MGKRPQNTDVHFWRDTDLPGVEVRYSNYCEEAFRDHTHPAYSVGMIETGWTSFTLSGANYKAKEGQLVVMPPHAVHACNPAPDSNMSYRMFYIEPSWLESIQCERFGPHSLPIRFTSAVIEDTPLFDHFVTLHEAIKTHTEPQRKKQMLLHGIETLLIHHTYRDSSTDAPPYPESVERACRHLEAHVTTKVSLDDLSAIAHVSRYHLVRQFNESLGMSPHAYQNQLRVNLGKKLLAEGLSISQVAIDTGFADQSHFARVFKRYTGATPLQYQATQQTA